MKSLLSIVFLTMFSPVLFGQGPGIDNKQLLIGIVGLTNPNEIVTHRIIAHQEVWENNGENEFFISEDDSLYNSS